MSDPAIRVVGLGKRYRLGATLRHDTLRDRIAHGIAASLRRKQREGTPEGSIVPGAEPVSERDGIGGPGPKDGEFWALREIGFDVAQGEVLGLIGRNGAGKSTLLKILGQITEPTEGEVRIRGRVASLLEVGTGFHPELTGRENIFLNGAILGMTRAEIRRNFDAIVAFAEVERFLDTPVKRYSSGMYVRLAFAVAAHLEPEILLVDEVLAVGDNAFQQKCLGKMDAVARAGRTVLLVSHNMGVIGRLCSRVILLDRGRVVADDEAQSVVSRYLSMGISGGAGTVDLRKFSDRSGDGSGRIVEASIRNTRGEYCDNFSIGDSIRIDFAIEYASETNRYAHSVEIVNSEGVPIYHLIDEDSRQTDLPPVRSRKVSVVLDDVYLAPDRYYVTLWVGSPQGIRGDRVANCLSFVIEQANARIGRNVLKSKGLFFKLGRWTYDDESR